MKFLSNWRETKFVGETIPLQAVGELQKVLDIYLNLGYNNTCGS
jgi:hypothetical protein